MTKKDTLLKLKEKEREQRQILIIEAAREVFGKDTYDKVSMAEIANAAGIAKSSIYTYFKSQEELYARIAYQDACVFIKELENRIYKKDKDIIKTAIEYFLDYYIAHEAQWRMITHFALHGNKDMGSVDKLNEIGRGLMDVVETIFIYSGCKTDTRLMSHTLFSCLSGVLIAFRNYPGRSEKERIIHMKRIGSVIESMIIALINQ
ncbi:MAG: TetR/AcrR family transcriptional regulator [Deltaproteobacteria bacterium]|nr:TetR/AcrR family transcriptional regulator [Deltaproteobacteria bacterium]